MWPCHFANKIPVSYIFVEILIVVFAFKNAFDDSTHFSMRIATVVIILFSESSSGPQLPVRTFPEVPWGRG